MKIALRMLCLLTMTVWLSSATAAVAPGEIAVTGRVISLKAPVGELSIMAASVELPGKGPALLQRPRPKTVWTTAGTIIRDMRGDDVPLTDLRKGTRITVTGEDRGPGRELPANQILVHVAAHRSREDVEESDRELPGGTDARPGADTGDLSVDIAREVNRLIRSPNRLPPLFPSTVLQEAAVVRAMRTAQLIPLQGWGPWLHLKSQDPWDITRVLTRLRARFSPYAENMELMPEVVEADQMVENLHWQTDMTGNLLYDREGRPLLDDHWKSLMNPRLRMIGAAMTSLTVRVGSREKLRWVLVLEATGAAHRRR